MMAHSLYFHFALDFGNGREREFASANNKWARAHAFGLLPIENKKQAITIDAIQYYRTVN